MQTQPTIPTPTPPRKRGRPAGRKDAKPRVRRPKSVVQAEPKPARKVREGDMQAQCMKWLDTVPAPGFPGHKLGEFCYAIPNGIWLPGANLQQRIRVIMTMRRQGLKKGIPDTNIDLPLHGYHGARIELKRYRVAKSSGPATTQMKPEQIEWLERLRAVGYFCEVAVGVAGYCAAVGRYLRGEKPAPFPWEEVPDGVHGQEP